MNKQKVFDCVQMKTDIQEQLQLEIAQLGEEEAGRLRRQRLLNDPILRRFLQVKDIASVAMGEHTPAA